MSGTQVPLIVALASLAVAIALSLWPYWFSTRVLRLPALNPFTIALMLGLPIELMKLVGGPLVLIEGGITDPGYQYALSMSSVLAFSELGGLLFFFSVFGRLRIERRLPFRRLVLAQRDMRRSAAAFGLFFVVAFSLLASAEFGILNWIANPRVGYQAYRSGQGHWYAIAISALAASMTLSFMAKPTAKSLLLRAPLFLGMAYLLGSKGLLLSVFSSMLVFLWFTRWKHLSKMFLYATPLIFGLLIWNLYLALGDAFEIQSVFEYFDYYKNAADYYTAYLSGEIRLFYGDILSSSYWAYVPRGLWPDKPVVYGVLIVNELFYPGQAELTNTPAFGGAVEQFADFGWVGVIFLGFFSAKSIVTAALSYLIFKRPGIQFGRITLPVLMFFMMQFAPSFGSFFPGILYLLLIAFVMLIIACLRNLRIRRHPPTREAHPADSGGTAVALR